MRAMVIVPRIGTGTPTDPYRNPLTGMTVWDATGQPVPDIVVAQNAYTVDVRCTEAQLAAIEADPQYIVLWSSELEDAEPDFEPLTEAEIDALRDQLATIYAPEIAELVTLDTAMPPEITNNVIGVQLRPPWRAGIAVAAGEVYAHGGNLYQVIQAHTTQSDWTPDICHALFKRFYEPAWGIQPWVQPQGAHDAYPLGAQVHHNGRLWQSNIDANVWEPGVMDLWADLGPWPPNGEPEPPEEPEWAPWTAYKVGDIVTYQGLRYQCRQSHTSQPGWEPPNVLALWLPL